MFRLLKRRLEQSSYYRIAREVKWFVQDQLKELQSLERTVISLKPEGHSYGNVLLSYIVGSFLLDPNKPIPNSHTHNWESLQIAKTFLDLGYSVDVISYLNQTFTPKKEYSIFIDARSNLQRLAPLLDKECLKIMHIDTSHALFKNLAEAKRLLAVQQRKGVSLQSRQFEYTNRAIEYADCATILGNEHTMKTFRYANKPLYRIPISTPELYEWPETKDFEACRRHYLWFGSHGLVHKGLDLVLEAFSGMPEYHLTVCGPIKEEEDFEKAYYKELYETSNIHTRGWIDISSPEFLAITSRCCGLVFPSCAEGQNGGVVTCLHAGLIPMISYQSGVDVNSFGVVFMDCSIKEIQDAVRTMSALPVVEVKKMARKAWEFARANHTRLRFSEEYRKAIETILVSHGRLSRGSKLASCDMVDSTRPFFARPTCQK